MNSQKITGGGGVQLHLVEAGNPNGRPLLFIHGLSQSWRAWSRQIFSDLADDYRLVAMDIRGHGLSDKPREGYGDSRLWADDVNAVIQTLGLDHPILSGWSYGPLIMLDYIRHYGEDGISGMQFVGGVTKLGSEEAMSVLSPEFINLVPGFFSTDVEESVRALESLIRLCLYEEPAAEELYLMLGYNVSVPPYDLMPKLRKPVLITYGANDAVVKQSVIEQQMSSLANSQVQIMANAGHAPFWDDAPTFNQRLRAFAQSVSSQSATTR